jgi:predicted TIM-barrel fold metal-dependent hydrolase
MIIDTHTHWPVEAAENPDNMLRTLDRFGIDLAVVCGVDLLHKIIPMREGNDRLMGFCAKSESRLLPLASVHLAEGDKAVEEARRCLERGAKGFKFHPWVQGEYVFRPAMYQVCALAKEFGVPLMFHDGTPVYSLPSQIGVLAQMHAETTFILGHGGILHFWKEAIEVTKQNPNVIITLCGQHPAAMQTVCDEIESDRILFGTDFIGPGAEEMIAYRKGLVEGLNLDPATRAKIMSENAKRVYRIE